jgi:transposase
MLAQTQDEEQVIARVAALDIGKGELVCCVRVPDEDRPGRRLQEVATYSTMTRSSLRLADRLRCRGVRRVVMEATSDYWKPVFYLLETHGFETWLASARDVKHLPGRPKTGKLDPAQFRAPAADPPPARCHPLPRGPGGGADRRKAAGREAAGGRADQAERGRVRHLRGSRAARCWPR